MTFIDQMIGLKTQMTVNEDGSKPLSYLLATQLTLCVLLFNPMFLHIVSVAD